MFRTSLGVWPRKFVWVGLSDNKIKRKLLDELGSYERREGKVGEKWFYLIYEQRFYGLIKQWKCRLKQLIAVKGIYVAEQSYQLFVFPYLLHNPA